MACPYFDPGERLPGSSGSLGDVYTGLCRADAGQAWQPDGYTLADRCNLGYARGRCAHFPAASGPDAGAPAATRKATGNVPGVSAERTA